MSIKSVKMKISKTHRVTTVDTLSGYQDFFLQPTIKDRPNIQLILCTFYFNLHILMMTMTSKQLSTCQRKIKTSCLPPDFKTGHHVSTHIHFATTFSFDA